MHWLHTWSGLLVGWILYFIFITGTAGYVDTEIDSWMRPEIPISINVSETAHLLALAEKRLYQQATTAASWSINFPAGRNNPVFNIRWQGAQGNFHEVLDPRTGQVIAVRETGGGRLLYRLHYRLHYMPRIIATWIVSICSMFMMIALISGIIIHKRIFKDMFTFRPRKENKAWLDMHNIFSVLSLPFQLMITYSGLLFLAFTTMSWVVSASYGLGAENKQQFFDEAFSSHPKIERADITAPMFSLSKLIIESEQRWGENEVSSIQIDNYNDANARIHIRQRQSDDLSAVKSVIYHGVSGELLHNSAEREKSITNDVHRVLLSTHEGLFAGTFLRFLYVLSGMFGAGMIATGLILWTRRKRTQAQKENRPHKGLALVERLNVATIIGLLIGIAAFFWSNRLLSVDDPNRASKEIMILFISWVFSLLYASFRTVHRSWVELSWLAAILYTLLPVLNYFTSQRHLIISIPQQDWVMAGFDLTMLVFGIVFGIMAIKLQLKNQRKI